MKQILAAIFCLFVITYGCVERTTKVEWVNPEGIGFQTEKDTMSVQALRTTPGAGAGNNGWMYEYQKAGLDTTGFALMSQDSNGLRQMMVTDEALDARYQGMISDSLGNFESIDSLYQENDSLKLLSYNVRQPVVAFDSTSDITGNYEAGTFILSRETAATYKVQSSSVTGYAADGVGVIDLGGKYAVLQPDYDGFYNMSHLGLSADSSDNYLPLKRSLDLSLSTGSPVKIDRPGVYQFATKYTNTAMDSDVHIKGAAGVVFQVDGQELMQLRNEARTDLATIDSVIFPITRGDVTLNIRNATAFGPGDLFAIQSTDSIPSVTNNEAEVFEVSRVIDDTTLLLMDSVLFNHEGTSTYDVFRAFKYHTLTLENIDLDITYAYGSTGPSVINIQGYNGVRLQNCRFINKSNDSQLADGLRMYGCANVFGNNLSYRNLRYGLLINNCHRIRLHYALVEDCRHMSALATWTRDFYASQVDGIDCRTPVESHVAYDIHYDNVRSQQTDQINIRGFGRLSVTNSTIHTSMSYPDVASTSYSLIGYHFADYGSLGSEYNWLIANTHMLFRNTEYIADSLRGKFRGISATAFATLTIENCTSTTMGAYERSGGNPEVYISNSRLGFLTADGGAELFRLENVVFDGRLAYDNYFMNLSQADTVIINGARFEHGDNIDIEQQWQANGGAGQDGAFIFMNVHGKAKSLAAASNTVGKAASMQMHFYNSFMEFTDTLREEYNTELLEDIVFTHNAKLKFSDQTYESALIVRDRNGNIKLNTGSNNEEYTLGNDAITGSSTFWYGNEMLFRRVILPGRVRLTSSNNRGKIELETDGGSGTFSISSSGDWDIKNSESTSLQFWTSNQRRAYFNSSGSFLIRDDTDNHNVFLASATSEETRIGNISDQGDYSLQVSGNSYINGGLNINGATVNAANLPEYADDTAAGVGGLSAGDIYQTSTGELRIKL